MLDRLLSRKFLGSSAVTVILLEQGEVLLATILTAIWVAVQGVVDGIAMHHGGVAECVRTASETKDEEEDPPPVAGAWRAGHGTVVVPNLRGDDDIEGRAVAFGFGVTR